MKSTIGSLVYFVSFWVAVIMISGGVFVAFVESTTPSSGLAPVLGGFASYLIGRDVRRVLKGHDRY